MTIVKDFNLEVNDGEFIVLLALQGAENLQHYV